MASRKELQSLLTSIERVLAPGVFIDYGQTFDFLHDLEEMQKKVDVLVAGGNAAEAVPLYEAFLAGTYEKMEQIDDSGGMLGMFFENLFCGWVKAREKAALSTEETLTQVGKWIENDDYGLCHDIELKVFQALRRKGRKLYEQQIQKRLNTAWAAERADGKNFTDYSWPVRRDIDILKGIYRACKNLKSYHDLCEQLGYMPQDCLCIAEIHKARKSYEDALEWTNRGIGQTNDLMSGFADIHLRDLKRDLLIKLGRGDEALDDAWSEFEKHPCPTAYETFMKFVPKKDRAEWHRRAIGLAEKKADLADLMDLCVQTDEWDVLIRRLLSARDDALEAVSHYHTEPVAKGLEKRDPALAARVYRALACRIVNAKKSKYYHIALSQLRKARDLYQATGNTSDWKRLVAQLREKHKRKYSFIGDFESLVAGKDPARIKSFRESAAERWQKMTE